MELCILWQRMISKRVKFSILNGAHCLSEIIWKEKKKEGNEMERTPKYFLKMPTVSAMVCVHDDSGFCLEVSGLLGFFPNLLIALYENKTY